VRCKVLTRRTHWLYLCQCAERCYSACVSRCVSDRDRGATTASAALWQTFESDTMLRRWLLSNATAAAAAAAGGDDVLTKSYYDRMRRSQPLYKWPITNSSEAAQQITIVCVAVMWLLIARSSRCRDIDLFLVKDSDNEGTCMLNVISCS